MPKLRVERKAHTRKAYLREDGTRVVGSEVSSSTFRTKDRGKPGRTPKEEQWFESQVPTGWDKDHPEAARRVKVLSSHGGDELASARAMQAIANVTTDRETKIEARADARYFYRIHSEMPKRRSHKRRAPRITPKQPRLRR